MRDRILPLGVRRHIQITRELFDFTEPPLSESDLEAEFEVSRVYDCETKRTLAELFIAQLDLSVALTDVISLVYPVNSMMAFDFNNMMQMPAKIEQCRDALDTWLKGWREKSAGVSTHSKHKSISLFSGLTQIYYWYVFDSS